MHVNFVRISISQKMQCLIHANFIPRLEFFCFSVHKTDVVLVKSVKVVLRRDSNPQSLAI